MPSNHLINKIVGNKIVKSTDKNNAANTKKRALSASSPQSPTTTNINKSKKFVTPNSYSILAPQESEPIIADNSPDPSIQDQRANTYH